MKHAFPARTVKNRETDPPKSDKEAMEPTCAKKTTKPVFSELSDTQKIDALLRDSTDIDALLNQESSEKVEDHASANSEQRELALYQRLLNGLYDAVLLVDAKGTIFCANKRAEKFFGYSADEVWNTAVEKLVRGVNAEILRKIRNHADSGRFTVINTLCKRKDETVFPAEIAINNIGLFNKNDMIFSIRNIERREKAKEQQMLRDDAIRGTGAAIAVCNTDGLIEYANPAFIRMTGSTSENDVLKRFMGDLFSSNEAVNAMVRTPSEHGFWMGDLFMSMDNEHQCKQVRAISNLAPPHPGVPGRLVVTLIPMPRASMRTAEKP